MVGLIIITIIFIWIAYEVWRAPLIDHKNNIIKPAKTFKDIFKKIKL